MLRGVVDILLTVTLKLLKVGSSMQKVIIFFSKVAYDSPIRLFILVPNS
jgi:hypothetical protein